MLFPDHLHTQEPHGPLWVLMAQFGSSDDLMAFPSWGHLMPLPLMTLSYVGYLDASSMSGAIRAPGS